MQDRGVFVTWEFFRDKSLTISEKFILLEINNLAMLEYGCIASNDHFSLIMGIKKEAVSRLINSLVNKGFLSSEIKNGTRNFSRKLTLNKLLFDPKQIVISPLTNCLETKGNKTNNTEGHPNEEQVVAVGRDLGIDEDVCIQFYLYYSSKGWKGILDFVPLLRKWNMNQKKTVSVDEEESWMRYVQ